MTAPDVLAKRIEDAERKAKDAADKLKQLKAHKAAIEARQKAIQAKRTKAAEQKRMAEVGNLARMARLLDTDSGCLLGAFLIAADRLGDAEYRQAAKLRGDAALAERMRTAESVRVFLRADPSGTQLA